MREKKFMMVGILILLISLVGSASTYAWFTWNSTSNTNLTMSIGASSDIVFKTGNNISTTKLAPVFNYSDGESTSFSIIRKNKSDTTNVAYKVILSITSIAEELKSTSFKYILIDSNSKVEVANGDFSNITNNSTITLVESILSERADYTLYIYIDGNEENNLNMINKKFEAVLTATAEEKIVNYELTNGDGSEYTPTYSGTGTKTVRSSATKSTFKEVKVDDVVVDPSNYTVTEGSTIITFTEAYLKTLSVGNHTIKIISNDGYALGNINIKGPTAAEYITNLYTSASKTEVTNNSITYNYATSVSLMNDRKGSSSTGIDAGNIRYYGSNPNNYIYFNCSDYSNQSYNTCEKWRIIGVFNNQVKIMRGETTGGMLYDNDDEDTYLKSISYRDEKEAIKALLYSSNLKEKSIKLAQVLEGTGQNDYSTSSLQKILNNYYYNRLKYTGKETYDFTSNGLKNDTTRNLISEVTYNLGGWNDVNIYPNEIYNYERGTTVYSGNSTTWIGKIAIPYTSDYSYAVNLNLCNQTLSNYYNSTCTANNWMKNIITNNGSSDGWLLTPNFNYNYKNWKINQTGSIISSGDVAIYTCSIVPTLILNEAIEISGGYGTGTNPYMLKV